VKKTRKKSRATKMPPDTQNPKSGSFITPERFRLVIFVLIFAFLGTYLFFKSFAATTNINFSGTLTRSTSTISHSFSVPDSGSISAKLTRIQGNNIIFNMKLKDSAGNVLAETNGVSPITVSSQVPAGTYTKYSISGTVNTIDRVSDISPPTAPTNLKGLANTPDSIGLSWNASQDDVGVNHYTIYRNGVAINNVTTTSFTDTGLVSNSVYNYTVLAVDGVGNSSPNSNSAPVITQEVAPAPSTYYTLDSSFDYPSKSDPSDYRQHVDFNVVCKVSSIAPDDPIVYPGQPGKAHMHVFTGNTSVNGSSTLASLEAGGTNCRLDRDKASYWMPELYDQAGTAVTPYHMRAYYRAGSLNPVAHTPHGLRIIGGDPTATVAQDKRVAGWQCRSVSPDLSTVPKQSTIPSCASTDLLEGSVVFPNCWDGVNLDSANHKSHMAYSWDDGNPDNCPSTHPVQIAQLTLAYRYSPGTTNSNAYLSSMHSGLTLHADFFNAWHQPTLDALVDRCINAGVHCGDVSPTHFPGPIPSL
jgi:hypothetical protein